MRGTRIGQYKLERVLGEGAFGEVWLAHDERLNRPVAIKRLKPEVVGDADARRRFDSEAEILIGITEPHVVHVFDRIEIDGAPALVTEYMKGGSLSDLRKTRDEPFSPDQVMRWAEQAAHGLSAMHRRGILHRDIKPANLFLSEDGNLSIGDFGLARDVDKTQTLGLQGTMPYMSPEQIKGLEIDARTDLFALGVSLYQMLTGELPFGKGLDRSERMSSARTQRKEVPATLSNTIDSLLEVDREKRIGSADELLLALRGEGPGFTLPGLSSRKLMAIVPILIAVVLGVAGGRCWIPGMPWCGDVGCGIDPPKSEFERRILFLPFEYRGDPQFARVAEEMPQLVAARLDGVADIATFPPSAMAGCAITAGFLTEDTPDATTWMNDRNADLVVHGAVSEIAGQYRIDLTFRLQKDRGHVTDKETISLGETADVLPAVNQIGLEVLRQLLVEPGDDLARETLLSTRSLDAMLDFLAGFHTWRVNWDPSTDLKQALELDPSMAMASLLRAEMEGSDTAENRVAYLRQAVLHAGKVGPYGRSLIRAAWFLAEGQVDSAEVVLSEVVTRYPRSAWGWLKLADLHYQHNATRGRPWWDSRREFEEVERLDPRNGQVTTYLWLLKTGQGDEDYIRNLTADRSVGGAATLHAFTIGSQAMRDSVLAAEGPRWCGEGFHFNNLMVTLYPDNHHNGLQFFEAHICDPDAQVEVRPADQAWMSLTLAHLNGGIGRWQAARNWFDGVPAEYQSWRLVYEGLALSLPFIDATEAELEEMIRKLDQWRPLEEPIIVDPQQLGAVRNRFHPHIRVHEHLRQYCLAALHARAGHFDEARASIAALRGLNAAPFVELFVQDLGHLAEARVAFEAGDWPEALAGLERVRSVRYIDAGEYSSIFQRADARYLRAECLMSLDRPEEALRWYDSADQNMEFLLIYTGMAHLRQAQANEQLGRQADAIEHYRIFVDLFDQPDDSYADDVAQARERLAVLQSAR